MAGGNRNRPARIATVLAAVLAAPAAGSADYPLGDGKLTVHGSAYIGAAVRTEDRDPKLLPNVNSSLLSITGKAATPTAGRSGDDGNLNFARGDAVATLVKGYLSLSYEWGDFAIEASGQAWYDYVTADAGHPWGNRRNGYTPGEPLSDAGAAPRSRFTGIVLATLSARGHHEADKVGFDWRLGYQLLDWGNQLSMGGGLRDLNPVDLPALGRPGVQRETEARIPFPALSARLALEGGTSVEGFYQLGFERHALQQCGTFYSTVDFMADGCNAVSIGSLSDPAAAAVGAYLNRTPNVDPSDSGQGGIAIRHRAESLATELSLFAVQFHSRTPFYSGTKSGRAGAPFLPGNPDGLNPVYFIEFPERIRMFGASFATETPGGLLAGELSYRPNEPLQYNSTDVTAAAVSNTAPTPLRETIEALPPGAIFKAWERHEVLQVQLGMTQKLPDVLGAAGASLGAEVVYKRVMDLPDPSIVRFRRSDMFGQGPVDGVCPPPAKPVACTFDGYVSSNAFAYRLRAGLRYPDVWEGVSLIPSLAFTHDVSGWSDDGLIVEGRMVGYLSLQADFDERWTGAIAWVPMWGGTYNNMRDRSTAQAYVGYRF